MAQNNTSGLFGGASVEDVYATKRAENRAKVRQAGADSANMGGNFYANLQAKANEQLGQAARGVVGGLLEGTSLAPAEDPRLAAASKREADRVKFQAMFKDLKMDSSEDYYKMAQEFRIAGYSSEADKLVTQGHGFGKEKRENTLVDVSVDRLSLETKVATDKQTLENQKQKFVETSTNRGMDAKDAEAAFAKVLGKFEMKNKGQLTVLQARKLSQDLEIETSRIAVTKELGLGNLSVAETNAETNKFNSKVAETYGLVEQGRKKLTAAASIKNAENTLELQSKLGLLSHKNETKKLDQAGQRIALEADRDQFGQFLKLDKLAYDKLSTDRLFQLSHDKQSFDQTLADRDMTSKEYLASHKVNMDGKIFDFNTMDKERAHAIALDDANLRRLLGTENLSLAQTDQAHKKFASDNNIRLKETKMGNDKEATRANQEILRAQLAWRKENDTANLKQKQIEALADVQLRQSAQELTERGIDYTNLNAQARIALASKEHDLNKFLGIAGLDNKEKDRKLTAELSKKSDYFKQAGIDLETASLHQKKILFKAELAQRGAIALLKSNDAKRLAGLKPVPAANRNDRIGVSAFLENTPALNEAFEKKYKEVEGLWNDNDEATSREEFTNDVVAYRAKNGGDINSAIKALLGGKPSSGSGDVSHLLNPKKKG